LIYFELWISRSLKEILFNYIVTSYFLKTDKMESLKSSWFHTLMNRYPMYFGTGEKILFWASDFSEGHLRLRLNIWNCNDVGTIFGVSMFSAADHFDKVTLLKSLGPSFVSWDK